MDYLIPDWATAILKAPSPRTQMESSLVGITIMMIGSLGVIIFMIATGIVTGFWFIFLVIASELGVLSFQFSLLSTTYQTYHSYKLEMGLYPEEYKLKLKIEEGKRIKSELDTILENIEGGKDGK
jgi:hypothetical protein